MNTGIPPADNADSPAPRPEAVASSSHCIALKGDGERCKAKPLQGKDTCRLHSLTPEERKANAARAQAASVESKARAQAERERKRERARMSTKERLAEVLEELQADVVAAYRTAMRTGSQEDLRKAQAAEMLLSRVHGRPAQPTRDETPTLAGDLAALEAMSLEDLAALARRLPADSEA